MGRVPDRRASRSPGWGKLARRDPAQGRADGRNLRAILSFFVGIGLRKRGAIGPILTATLIALAVLSMATFRYVQALG
jgi:hypothetical protein